MPGRLALTGAPDGPAVVDDTYNANPVSVAAGLSAAVAMAQGRPLALVLGDMKELGELAPRDASANRFAGGPGGLPPGGGPG